MTAPTPEQALNFMYQAVLYQNIDLTGPWQGWKVRGQYLVSPDKDRIPVRELIGLLVTYRRRFGHRRAGPASKATSPGNVVSFSRAASRLPPPEVPDRGCGGGAPARPIGPSMGHGWPALASAAGAASGSFSKPGGGQALPGKARRTLENPLFAVSSPEESTGELIDLTNLRSRHDCA